MRTETLREWLRRWSEDKLQPRPRGRPIAQLDCERRKEILALFDLTGRLGLPTLQELCPDASRSELIELQRWHERISHKGRTRIIRALRWTRPGAVWAIDFSDPPDPIDGHFDKLLCVRDLASGYMILATPCPDASTMSACMALESMTRYVGAPLVLKADNGSAFISQEFKDWAAANGILMLYSPPSTPEYNGAIEAGIGSIKTRALWIAARNDRPWHWTCDDVDAARRQANLMARPNGPHGGAPKTLWHDRLRVEPPERSGFRDLYDTWYARERARHGYFDGIELQHADQAAIDRVAIARALVDRGYLRFRRRRITPPISSRSTRKIS